LANGELGQLSKEKVDLIVRAAQEVIDGRLDNEFPLVVFPKSGVKFNVFQQIGPKIDICSQNLCSSRSNFTKVASAFQRFQPVNSTQYLLGLLSNEGRVD